MRMVGQSRPEWSGTRGCRYHRRMESTPTAPGCAGDDAGHGLPLDAQSILELAARSMFHVFSSISQGMFLIDRTGRIDRKSTRLNSSHHSSSYAVFCLKK